MSSPLVELTVSDKKVYEKIFTASVNVRFDDISVYDEATRLSYHVYDSTGNLIAWDYPRTSFSLDANHSSVVEIPVDLNEIPGNGLTVQFDMVVEGQYWYSQRTDICAKFDSVQYESYTACTYIADNLFVFTLILIGFVFAVVAIIIITRGKVII